MKIDISYWNKIIEYFRHMIVHENSKKLKNDFWEGLSRKSGARLVGKSRTKNAKRKEIKTFLKAKDDYYSLCFVEVTDPLNVHAEVCQKFNWLTRLLSSHVAAAYKLGLRYFGYVPYWDK